MILVIAEKPSVAQTIAAVLGAKEKKDGFLTGSGYIVSWCVGHLVGLAEAATYGEQYKKWSYDSLPILPQEWKYTVASDKEKQFKTLKELMHRADVSEVVNACDAGREGELIFRFVYEVAGCRKPTRRLWISSMEEAAIKEGFSHLKNGEEYDALFASALCRAKADWLIAVSYTHLCDPEAEYFALVKRLGGQVIRLSPTGKGMDGTPQYVNPMDMNLNYSEDDSPLALKSDFILPSASLSLAARRACSPLIRPSLTAP